jgi:hypothetical protein
VQNVKGHIIFKSCYSFWKSSWKQPRVVWSYRTDVNLFTWQSVQAKLLQWTRNKLMSVSYNQLPSYCNHKECQYSVSKIILTFPCSNKLVLWINSLPSASNSQKFFLITIFIIIGQNSIKNKIPYCKLTWTILHVKSEVTFTSTICTAGSMTTAIGCSFTWNYEGRKRIKNEKMMYFCNFQWKKNLDGKFLLSTWNN